MDTLYNQYSLKTDTFLVKRRAIDYKGVYCIYSGSADSVGTLLDTWRLTNT